MLAPSLLAWLALVGPQGSGEGTEPPPSLLAALPGDALFVVAVEDFASLWERAPHTAWGQLASEPVLAPHGDPRVQVWSTSTGELVQSWPTTSAAWKVRFTPDGERIVAGHGNTISVWELSSGEKLHDIATSSKVWDVAVGPASDLIAATSWDPLRNDIELWSLTTGEFVRKLDGHARPAVVTFSPDGSRLVAGHWFEGSLSLWDLERGAVVSLHGLQGTVRDVVFSPDGRRMASACSRGGRALWWMRSSSARSCPRTS